MRRKSKRDRRRIRVAVVSGLTASAGVIGGYAARRLRRAPSTDDPAAAQQQGNAGRMWQCECGEELRVTGEGRHRVFWRPEASPDDPLLDDRCPNCGRVLSLQG